MTESPITYQNLFILLVSLGFKRQTGAMATNRHVFCHEPTDTILAFGRQTDDLVTPADMLSTEVHLQARGIAEDPLALLVNAAVLESSPRKPTV